MVFRNDFTGRKKALLRCSVRSIFGSKSDCFFLLQNPDMVEKFQTTHEYIKNVYRHSKGEDSLWKNNQRFIFFLILITLFLILVLTPIQNLLILIILLVLLLILILILILAKHMLLAVITPFPILILIIIMILTQP